MKLVAIIALGLCLCAVGGAQSFEDYSKLRKLHNITSITSVQEVDAFLGEGTFEIQGVVKGSFQTGDSAATLMFERANGKSDLIDAPKVPDWLIGNEIAVRMVVRAVRTYRTDQIRMILLGAAPANAFPAESSVPSKAASPAKPISRAGVPNRRQPSPAPVIRAKAPQVASISEAVPIYANFIRKVNPKLSPAKAFEIAQGVIGFSYQKGVDARLIVAMIMVESGFKPNATSHKGAMGLGQLMPGTARELGVRNAYSTVENIYGMVKLMRGHLKTYKKKTGEDFQALVLSIAAYNAGPGAVSRHGGIPPFRETQNYVRKVLSMYRQLTGG